MRMPMYGGGREGSWLEFENRAENGIKVGASIKPINGDMAKCRWETGFSQKDIEGMVFSAEIVREVQRGKGGGEGK